MTSQLASRTPSRGGVLRHQTVAISIHRQAASCCESRFTYLEVGHAVAVGEVEDHVLGEVQQRTPDSHLQIIDIKAMIRFPSRRTWTSDARLGPYTQPIITWFMTLSRAMPESCRGPQPRITFEMTFSCRSPWWCPNMTAGHANSASTWY